MKTTFQYDHYIKYDELKSELEYFEKTYPSLCKLEVNMVTQEGRNQYAAILNNEKTGAPLTKPGFYLDGNIHAGEVTATMTAMHTLDYLLTNYGKDKECTWILDHLCIYVIPRVTPDGAEKYLTTPYSLRSAPRSYCYEKGGIRQEDLDHDGVVRMMRIPSKYGAWKIDQDGKMTFRSPSDVEGTFYDVYPEGIFNDYEGSENLKREKAEWGLDFNRNFPLGWFDEARQPGAGPYPLSNPENKAIVDFVLAHPNIGGAAIGHTSGGLLLYPPGTRPSKSASSLDIENFRKIADMGAEELGYKPMNIFDSFMRDQEHYDSGALDDWFYQSQGVPAYTMEFWDVSTKAGVPMVYGKEEDKKEGLKRFYAVWKWAQENAPEYCMDWKEFDHPVFGKVEIGGMDFKHIVQNPPEKFLKTECMHDTKFNLRFMKALPYLSVDSLSSKDMGNGLFKVTAMIGNEGFLPTNLSDEAVALKKARPVTAELKGAELLSGKACEELGNLDGYSATQTGSFYGNLTTFANGKARKKVEWLVKGMPGDTLTLTVKSEKAGTVEKTLVL